MKNNKKIIGLILALFLLFMPIIYFYFQKDVCLDTGGSWNQKEKNCEKSEKILENNSENISKNEIEYSNFVDEKTQNEVKTAMQKAGISAENISDFFQNVEHFNTITEKISLHNSGFGKFSGSEPNYDLEKIMEKWDSKKDFMGFNCRITSFLLLKDFIKIEKTETKDPENLIFDLSVLENTNFSEKDIADFKGFFAQIPTELTKDVNIHEKKIKENFSQKGIEFLKKWDKTQASLVSVFMHSAIKENESFLFVGHIWVLIPNDKNFYFVEKIAFEAPYQVLKFENKKEVVDYLMKKYNDENELQPTSKPLIFENDELMEGYKK